jgi:DNA-binding HxlR family transcriptional regulator
MSRRNTEVTLQVDHAAPETESDADHSVDPCELVEVIDRVSGKWSIGILVATAQGPIRFTELERTVKGISRRMLTLTLRHLERDGLIERTVYPTVPPKVEYSLTPISRDLYSTLAALTEWADRNRACIAEARAAYDERQAAAQ